MYRPLAVFVVLALQPSLSSLDPMRHAPAQGLRLEKSFTTRGEIEQQVDTGEGGTSAATSDQSLTITFVDEVLARDDDRITKLERSIEDVDGSRVTESSFGSQQTTHELVASSPAVDAEVVFTWDAEEERYVASSDDLDAEDLERMDAALDFAFLLPEGEVEEGDEWSLDTDAFQRHYEMSDPFLLNWHLNGSEPQDSDADYTLETETDGELGARFVGITEEDGVRLARIAIEGEVEIGSSSDTVREMQWGTQRSTMTQDMVLDVEGEALWNLDGHHLHGIELEVTQEADGEHAYEMEFSGETHEGKGMITSSGELEFSAQFRVVDCRASSVRVRRVREYPPGSPPHPDRGVPCDAVPSCALPCPPPCSVPPFTRDRPSTCPALVAASPSA